MTSKSLARGLLALETVAARPDGVTQAELGRSLGVDRSTALRLLQTLEQAGYVARGPTGRYRLTLKLARLGQAAYQGLDLRLRAAETVRRLTAETGLSSHLAVLLDREVVYVDGVDGPGRVSVRTEPGAVAPVHCTATGKALAAYLPPDVREEVIRRQGGLPAFTPRTITDPRELAEEYRRVRLAGYATDDEEFEPGVRCVAAPVFDHRRLVVAVLGVSGTTSRLSAPAETDPGREQGREPDREQVREPGSGQRPGRLSLTAVAELVAAAADAVSLEAGCLDPASCRKAEGGKERRAEGGAEGGEERRTEGGEESRAEGGEESREESGE